MAAGGAALAAFAWRFWPSLPARLFRWSERRRGKLRSCRMQVDGVSWHYLEGGHGEPLVLLHGFNGDAYHFARVARHLGAHFRVLAPDLPGFGETTTTGSLSCRAEDLADTVNAWLDALNIQTCYLGGNSMGGYVATAVACRHPERVRALWLLAPGGLRDIEDSPVFEEITEDRHNPLVVRNLAEFRKLIDYCFVRPPWIPRPVVRFLAARAARTAVQAQRIFDALQYDSRPLDEMLPGLQIPVLVTWGRADQVLHPCGARRIKELLPEAEILMLPGIGHLPMLEAPCMTAEAWVSYTERCARHHGHHAESPAGA